MLKKEDLDFFKKHYPNTDFGEAYWSFVSFFNAGAVSEFTKNMVTFGLSFKGGGRLVEMVMVWESPGSRYGPIIRPYMDAALMLACPMLKEIMLIIAEKQNCLTTPTEFSAVLLSLGFEDITCQEAVNIK